MWVVVDRRYLVRKQDTVHLFYKNTREDIPVFFDNYAEVLTQVGVTFEKIYSQDKSKNVAKEIVELAEELQTEFIVMGKKRTRSSAQLGSITDHVATRSRCSLIICKDTRF